MNLPPGLLSELEDMPRQLEEALRSIPGDRLGWTPGSWEGCPSETFTALEQICHLRDIEMDGYHVRIERMLTESEPALVSLDSYELARERRYASADAEAALAGFRQARGATVEKLRGISAAQLERTGQFAEYGRLTLLALIHYLRSHDQQHLAGIQWLAAKIAST